MQSNFPRNSHLFWEKLQEKLQEEALEDFQDIIQVQQNLNKDIEKLEVSGKFLRL